MFAVCFVGSFESLNANRFAGGIIVLGLVVSVGSCSVLVMADFPMISWSVM